MFSNPFDLSLQGRHKKAKTNKKINPKQNYLKKLLKCNNRVVCIGLVFL